MRIALGITGASGIIYGLALSYALKKINQPPYCIVSSSALKVADYECGSDEKFLNAVSRNCLKVYRENDLVSPLASSSFLLDAGVIAPCSLKTLSDIANSHQDTLISRTSGNLLRLRRKLILLIRETPLSVLDIINMFNVSLAGAVIMPAAPAFYHKPRTIEDLVNFIVGKILDVLGIPNELYLRWEKKSITRGNPLCDQFSY